MEQHERLIGAPGAEAPLDLRAVERPTLLEEAARKEPPHGVAVLLEQAAADVAVEIGDGASLPDQIREDASHRPPEDGLREVRVEALSVGEGEEQLDQPHVE